MIKSVIERLRLAFLHLLFPSFCCVCQKPVSYTQYVCEECCNQLEKSRVKKARVRTLYGNRFRVHSVYYYDDDNAAATIVKRLKFARSFNCSNLMGEAIADKVRSLHRQIDIVTYVPMTLKAENKRTFNHCEYICDGVAKCLKVKERTCLKKIRETCKQHKLSSVDRKRNLKNSFKAFKIVRNKNILLVDDVTTTGTTLSECANVMLKGGAKSVTLVAFSLTKPHR